MLGIAANSFFHHRFAFTVTFIRQIWHCAGKKELGHFDSQMHVIIEIGWTKNA